MPQVDLEALVSSVCAGSSDRKIACETTFSDHQPTRPAYSNYNDYVGSPPESYFLAEDAHFEWLNNNAFFDRQDSQRGNSTILNSNPNSNPNSQRFLLKSKASIIGLPKPQKTCFNEAKQHRRSKNKKVILKRVGSRIKTDISLLEPTSPKVSCIGKVRSRRERSRRHRQKSVRVEPLKEKVNRVKKPGFLASFRAILKIGGGCKDVSAPPSRTKDIRSRLPVDKVEKSSIHGGEPVVPGLGGMNRFASGRRPDSFGGC
ncbi:hypothetical protein AALP_AA4G134300 [Arabis alpina]|uniref:Uncharacterized protein n=1 Tax=Arabis alpina TaxID=50452 RepID=A0A087H314_ARAAL|nr:hypothetical protein AALP_AA4G134300 [Arabis alpina]